MTALPYSFARRHGVVVDQDRCVFQNGASAEALLEVQRRFGTAIAFEAATEERFETAIATVYRETAAGSLRWPSMSM